MPTATLTSPRVTEIFRECLFSEGEDTSSAVIASGIVVNAGFHPQRLAAHKEELHQMLLELPEQFRLSVGKGWSFLQACERADGVLWTGEHRVMEQLFLLGLATGLVTELVPRESWHLLPANMPYYVVND